ncbi:hypothetical protein HY407_02495 [Candidatus Gottesmanbacteria bacterium]|nr:hypothetical protein [Candidatus Gottesmanbacteria bacterium]
MRLKPYFLLFIVTIISLVSLNIFLQTNKEKESDTKIQNQLRETLATHFNFHLINKNEDPNTYTRSQMSICYQNGGIDLCYKHVANLLYYQFGLEKNIDLFESNENYPEIFSRCHEVTHFLSRLDYDLEKSLPKVFDKCSFICHGGCYHGTVEAYLNSKNIRSSSDNSDEKIAKEIPILCGKQSDYDIPQKYDECVHGIGHGTMYVTDQEVPIALQLCDQLTSSHDQEACYSGVFHENSSSSTNTDHPGKYYKKDDPMYPCNILEEKYLPLCYRYQSSFFAFFLTNHDWQQTANLCLQVPPKYQYECFQTIGTNQVGFTQDLGLMAQNCYSMPPQYQSICISGVVISLAGRYTNQPEKILAFCSSIDPNQQLACYGQMGKSISAWSRDSNSKKNICQKVTDPLFATICENAT